VGRLRIWLDLALLLLAYRQLVFADSPELTTTSIESWFFVPTSSSTPALLGVGLAGWIAWRRRSEWTRLRAGAKAGERVAAVLAWFAGLAMLACSQHAQAYDLLAGSLALMMSGACLWEKGWFGLRLFGLPLAVLLLSLPLPAPVFNELAYQMQLATAQFSGWVLFALGQPAVIAADQILRAEASFAVIETCSGLRGMETLLTLSALMAELFGRRGLHTALLLVSALLVGFLVNGARVVSLVLNPHSEIHSIHSAQGIAVLLVGLLLLYFMDGRFERLLAKRGKAERGSRSVAPSMSWVRSLGFTCALLLSVGIEAWRPTQRLPVDLGDLFPANLVSWRSADLKFDDPYFGSLAFQQRIQRRYFNSTSQIDVFAGLADHARHRRGPFSTKLAVPGSGWVTESRHTIRLGKRPSDVEVRVCRRRTARQLVYFWIEGSDGIGDEIWRSLLGLDQSRWRRRRDALLVRMGTEIDGSDANALEAAERRLAEFLALLEPSLDRLDRRYPRKTFSDFRPDRKTLSLAGISR
jgi:exosortase